MNTWSSLAPPGIFQHVQSFLTILRKLSSGSLKAGEIQRIARTLGLYLRKCFTTLQWLLAPSLMIDLLLRHSLALILFYFMLSTGLYLKKGIKSIIQWIQHKITPSPRYLRIKALKAVMNTASSFERWKEAASEIDLLENRFQWKDDPKSDDYDYKKIQQRLMALRSLIEADDTEAIIRYLRSRLVRNIGGIGNHSLHTFMYTGTKTLIEEYISEVETALKQVLHDSSIEKSRKLAFFNETRHAFGRSALLLSGGGSMGLYHAGVLKALYQRDLLPRILSGASVGSILAAFVATRTDKEIEQLFLPNSVELSFFPPHKGSFMRKLRRLLSHGVLMDISVLLDCVRSNIGDFTFAEAYARTGRVLNIVVAPDSGSKDSPLLLNHLTSPDVLVWSASIASCAIPGVYLPVELMCKDCDGNVVPYFSEGVKWRDGSVVADLPMERLSELFNVNHFIVSQVNPHVLPFVFPTLHAEGSSLLYSMVSFLGGEIKAILLNLYNFTSQHIPLTKIIWDLLNQQYMGDITLFPQTKLIEFSLILTNPSEERLVQCMSDAEKYTFRRMY